MKSFFASRYVLISIISIIMLFALIAGYFALVSPQKQRLEQTGSQLKTEKKLLATLQQQQTPKQAVVSESTKNLQRHLPVKPLEDQFLLELQKAELKSGSEIQTIGITDGKAPLTDEQRLKQETNLNYSATGPFGKGNDQVQTGQQSNEVGQSVGQQAGQQTSAAGQKANTAQSSANQSNSANNNANITPNSLKAMTFNLSLKSPKYENLIGFLQEIEGLERFSSIDSLSFTGNQETQVGPLNQGMNYNLTVSTYYAPGFTDLSKDVPIIEYPLPQKKENPLYSVDPNNEGENTPGQ